MTTSNNLEKIDHVDIDKSKKKTEDFRKILSEFYDFVIWESVSQILSEIPGKTENQQIITFQTELKNLFLESIYQNTAPSDIKRDLCSFCEQKGFIQTPMGDYIVESLSIFRLRLLELFTAEELSSVTIRKSRVEDLIHTIEEYVLTSYLDKIVLSDLFRVFLYSSNISFGELNEFRIHFIELFKESLESKITLKEINNYLYTELNRLSIKPIIREYISASLFGYIAVIVRNQDYNLMIELMKKAVKRKLIIRSDLTFLDKNRLDYILNWIMNEGISPLFELLDTYHPNFNSNTIVKSSLNVIHDLFSRVLERKLNAESAIERINSIKNQFVADFIKSEIHDKLSNNVQDLLKSSVSEYEFKNRFITNNKISTMIESKEEDFADLTPERALELLFDSIIQFIAMLDNELETDFKLDKLYAMIKERGMVMDQLYL
jgi:hypothetical protein